MAKQTLPCGHLNLFHPATNGLVNPESVQFEVSPRDGADALAPNSHEVRAIGRQAAF